MEDRYDLLTEILENFIEELEELNFEIYSLGEDGEIILQIVEGDDD